VADGDLLPGLGVRHQALIGMLVVQVEHGGQRFGRAAQGGVIDGIGDSVTPKPDLPAVAQAP
jgi:hypothetical protein